MDSKDEEIQELTRENQELKASIENLRRQINILLRAAKSIGPAYSSLLRHFAELSKHVSDCTVGINNHYVAFREGGTFDAEFVRQNISKLVDAYSAEAAAVQTAVNKNVLEIESIKAELKQIRHDVASSREDNGSK